MTTTKPQRKGRLHRGWQALLGAPPAWDKRAGWLDVRAQHPRFTTAVFADARVTAAYRGERYEFRSHADAAVQAIRLAMVTDSFFAQCCYRAKARCQTRSIPVLPRVLHRLAIITGQISIGDPVVVQPGVYIPHGQIVIDGVVEIDTRVVLSPFVTIGLAGGPRGPTIGSRARIGTGAKVIGPVHIGAGAQVGANAVVLNDVPDGATAVGVPARIVS